MVCPYCGSTNVEAINPVAGKYHCRTCGAYFQEPI